MSRARMALVSALVAVIVGGHLVDAAMQKDHWPFAAYPMFSGLNKPAPFTSEELWGVTTDGREIPITSDMTGVLRMNRVRPSLFRLYLRSNRKNSPEPKAAENAMLGLLEDYELRRQRGEHDGPELAQLKFYQLRWEFDWWAKNRHTPQRKVLVETPPPIQPEMELRRAEKVTL